MARQVHAIEDGAVPEMAYESAKGNHLEPEQGALARTMVTLYTQLSRQIHELDMHSQHLEEMVQERTAHLNTMASDLARARDAAESGSRAKSRFIGAISHELRTPMNAVLGFSHLLHDGQLPPKQAQLAQQIVQSSEHLLKLINDLIDYARIDTEQEEMSTLPFLLQTCLDKACANAFETARGKGVDCRVEIDPALAPRFLGDAQRIVSALRQFVENAAKFTERGAILVKVRQLAAEAEWVKLRFSVMDTGIGIPKEQQTELFLAFQQLDDSPSRKYAGIGLGLALAHHLVEQMGGEVGMQSMPSKGSQFWMDLWLMQTGAEVEAAPLPVKPVARKEAHEAAIVLDRGKVAAVLERMVELLRQYDTVVGDYFDSEQACLRQVLGEHFDEVSGQISRFEYDRALKILNEQIPESMRQMEKQT